MADGRGRYVSRLRRSLEGRPVFSRLLENASWLMAERVLALALAFVFNAWLVRYLGPSEYGRYAYAINFVALFGAVATLGMDSIVVRELARAPEAHGEILGTALAIRGLAGLATWAVATAAVLPLRADAPTRWVVAVAGVNIVCLATNVFELWFQARVAARGLVVSRLAVAVGGHVVRGALILAGAGVTSFAVLFSAVGATTTFALLLLYRARRESGSRLRWSGAWASRLLRDSWPMVIVAVGIAVNMKADQVLLTLIAGDRENGIYAPAVTLSELWYFIPTAISASVFPVIVRTLDELPQAQAEPRLRSFYDGMAGMAYAVTLVVLLSADFVVPLLFGPAFRETAVILKIHVLSLVFVSLGIARGRYLVARNMLGFNIFATLAGAALNVGLNLWLVPLHGAVGAAWATLGSYAAANYLAGLAWPPAWRQTWLMTQALALPARLAARAVARGLAR